MEKRQSLDTACPSHGGLWGGVACERCTRGLWRHKQPPWEGRAVRLTLGEVSQRAPKGPFEGCRPPPPAPPWKMCSERLIFTSICNPL